MAKNSNQTALDFLGASNKKPRGKKKGQKTMARTKRKYTRRVQTGARRTTRTGTTVTTTVKWVIPASPRLAFQIGLALGQAMQNNQ